MTVTKHALSLPFLCKVRALSNNWFLHVRPSGDDDPDQTDNANNPIVAILNGLASVNAEDMSSQLNCTEDYCNYDEHDSEDKHHFVHDSSRLLSIGLQSKKYLRQADRARLCVTKDITGASPMLFQCGKE